MLCRIYCNSQHSFWSCSKTDFMYKKFYAYHINIGVTKQVCCLMSVWNSLSSSNSSLTSIWHLCCLWMILVLNTSGYYMGFYVRSICQLSTQDYEWYSISTAFVTCGLIWRICVSAYLLLIIQAESISSASLLEIRKRTPYSPWTIHKVGSSESRLCQEK